MPTFTKTISNVVTCLGPDETQKWGGSVAYPMVWGVSKWGLRGMLVQNVKFVTISFSAPSTSTVSKRAQVTKSETMLFAMETSTENLQSGNGYYYVFVKPSENAEDRPTNTYVAATRNTPVYTSLNVTSTIWS